MKFISSNCLKAVYIGLILILGFSKAYSQQELQMTNYLFNGLYWNPGYAGSHDFLRVTASYRHQWAALQGAPRTAMVSADLPLTLDNMGIALQLVNDRLGASNMTEVYATYAYQVKLREDLKLGIGIRAGVSSFIANYSDLAVWDAGDDLFENQRATIPKVGFGAYLHHDKFYFGIAVPTLWAYISQDYNFSLDINRASWLRRHLYISGAYVFDLNEDFKLKPSLLTKYVPNAPFQADFNATVIWKDMVHFSLGYRTNAAAMMMLEVQPFEYLRFGYAFDLSTPQYLRMYGGTTHEIMLGYDLIRKDIKYRSPRHF
jgi:type IX secretion system PorP/SprF family membrane protein